MYATHQIAKYSSDPRKEHGEAVIYLVRYLKKTRDIGLKFKPDSTYGFECYCDADFSGNWLKFLIPALQNHDQRNLETPENAPRHPKSSLQWPTLAVNSKDSTAIIRPPPAQVIAYKTLRDE
eukprot:scaffold63216_cov39-Cyclotella_meneghiniana.AAC.1